LKLSNVLLEVLYTVILIDRVRLLQVTDLPEKPVHLVPS